MSMNSSTSSSDAPLWRHWIGSFCVVAVAGLIVLYATIVLVDPFSTGRFAVFDTVDIAISDRMLAGVGRARDSRFDAAIIGNSHAERFNPRRLDDLTGRRFVQLSVPGLGPPEQMVMARAFLSHHQGPRLALLWVMDHFWCHSAQEPALIHPNFPTWLYESSRIDYLRRIYSIEALQATAHRLAIRLFNAPSPWRLDGYVERAPVMSPGWIAREINAPRPVQAPPATEPFPSLDRLDELLSRINQHAVVALVLPPYFLSKIPESGTPAAARLDACKARLADIAQRHAHGEMIDRMRADNVARDPGNFLDATHMRDQVVRDMEVDIAPVLRIEGGGDPSRSP